VGAERKRGRAGGGLRVYYKRQCQQRDDETDVALPFYVQTQ